MQGFVICDFDDSAEDKFDNYGSTAATGRPPEMI
jgi:hypothetical protein